jgi:hypothetical protein
LCNFFGAKLTHGIYNNISKVQLNITSRFRTTTKVIQTKFAFSLKNYPAKVCPCFAKVVDLVIRKPKKLELHFYEFSAIFFEFPKIQAKHTKG